MSRIAVAVSVSGIASTDPPVARASASAASPSAGLPMASERTIVSGVRTGDHVGLPSRQAFATGAHPAACPPTNRTGRLSMSPIRASSSNPRPSLVNSAPDAIGATTTSGVRHPRPSAISNASVLEPSA